MRIGEVWDELMTLERRMDEFLREPFGAKARALGLSFPSFSPAIETYRKNGELVTRVELPGLDPTKDVTVTVEDGDLVVRGERKQSTEVKEEDYYRKETSYGAFERRTSLPEGVTEDDVKAEYHDGLLEIHVPASKEKIEPPKAKAIPIKTTVKKPAV